MAWQYLVWQWALALLLRLALLYFGMGDWLLRRPEVSTPANTALKTREGLWLLQMGVSPYSGSSCHTPPLWLAVTAPWAEHKLLFAVPNIVCDMVAAAAVLAAVRQMYRTVGWQHKRDAPWLTPQQLSLLYLLHPFTILSCVAGTTMSAENMAVMVAACGGVMRNGPLAAAGMVLGAYFGLHSILLLVPLLLLLWRGAEDVLQHTSTTLWHSNKIKAAQDGGNTDNSHVLEQPQDAEAVAVAAETVGRGIPITIATAQQQQQINVAQITSNRLGVVSCLAFVAAAMLTAVALLVLSDQYLEQHPQMQCIPSLFAWLCALLAGQSVPGPLLASCWLDKVYRLTVMFEDLTPNIGMYWYFFTEMFDAFRPFFLFVFHSFAVILSMPMAVRFHNRPFFVLWVQLYITCMVKPYACVGDMVPWMVLLPLLQQQLQCIQLGMFLINSLLLIFVLGPAMWYQWIEVDAANSNFFYSITLLLGVWYTVFLVQVLRLTALVDRRLAGKAEWMAGAQHRADKPKID